MSISGISSSNFWQTYNPGTQQNQFQQFQQEFQQLGQDLQSGNLSQAQSDFTTLQQNAPAGSPLAAAGSTSSSSGTSTIAQEFNQLATDLQSGNLTAAQSDYSNIQQTAQQNGLQGMQGHHHHHHHSSGSSQNSSQSSSTISQEFAALGQDLQSGNVQSAQQAYSSLQQSLQLFASSSGSSNNTLAATQSGINISI